MSQSWLPKMRFPTRTISAWLPRCLSVWILAGRSCRLHSPGWQVLGRQVQSTGKSWYRNSQLCRAAFQAIADHSLSSLFQSSQILQCQSGLILAALQRAPGWRIFFQSSGLQVRWRILCQGPACRSLCQVWTTWPMFPR